MVIPALEKVIAELTKNQHKNSLLFGHNIKPGATLCGKQVPFRRHEKALKQLRLLEKGYTLYSWKHTRAVNAYLAGVGIKELQNM